MSKAKKAKAGRYRSRLSAAIHQTVAGLRRIDLVDKAAMREFDASCVTLVGSSVTKKKAIRKPAGVGT
jgi:DNA-binding transcriptional regulator YiaG